MKMKSKLLAAGLISGLAIAGSPAASAGQTCLEMPGELHLISVEGRKRDHDFGTEYDLARENRIRLNEKAIATCAEGEFCVENASIKTTYTFHPWTRIGHGTMTAVVNCLK